MEIDVQWLRSGGGERRASGLQVIGGFDGGEGFDGEEVWDGCFELPWSAGGEREAGGRGKDVQPNILALFDCNAPIKCQAMSAGSYRRSTSAIHLPTCRRAVTHLLSLLLQFLWVILPEMTNSMRVKCEDVRGGLELRNGYEAGLYHHPSSAGSSRRL